MIDLMVKLIIKFMINILMINFEFLDQSFRITCKRENNKEKWKPKRLITTILTKRFTF